LKEKFEAKYINEKEYKDQQKNGHQPKPLINLSAVKQTK